MLQDRLVYFNGAIIPAAEARLSVLDHGFLYGDGIFEGIRAYHGRVFKLDEHLKRLYDGARALMLDLPPDPGRVREAVVDTVRANGLENAYIRLVVSRGAGDLGLDPNHCPQPTMVVIADQIQLYPEAMYTEGLEVAAVSTRRPKVDALNAQVKSLNYLNSIMAKIEANQRGLPEVLLLSEQGWVAEGTGDNIFIVRDGELWTPPPSLGILNGITRRTVMELARELGIPYREDVFSLFDLYTAEEAFLTGTAAELVPVVRCDGRPIGTGKPGPVFARLKAAFHELTAATGTPVYPPLSREAGAARGA
ncbi:Putative branched-chain-amino-acid aminotransferase [Candidatus Hydrogenisulfobacillus filiaventi]|uniref:Branched-chain-amino-acid aminotransferase n=1 Tax=Candidatus Hydrogenisulfobacillus filiaventi TaxID=2707344 RepID=A0A6F8ZFT2_9FIRM|nr:branched-chain-amino-acid transaminase [Bacillota bacterium]CAB1128322.1 Putative branched-chain-amino-acid aminotransferase [Candidatus Hydrogenisulfobacillus filiaventi]